MQVLCIYFSRPLAKMCMNELVCEGNQISSFETDAIPADLYPKLLAEAIFQRQLQTIDFLVSTWPHSILDLQSVMPKEDLVEAQLLTIPIEGHDGITFLDCIMCGLLRQKYSSRLRTVNLSGFKQGMFLLKPNNNILHYHSPLSLLFLPFLVSFY